MAEERAMARKRGKKSEPSVTDYRHDEAKRKNNPEVGLANWEKKRPPRQRYEYDPHKDPQLQWAGKAEHLSFEVDTVSLHIHERVSAQALINALKRNGRRAARPQQLALFADPQLPLDQAVEFYQHDVDWANRLILGDSLLVMNSLLHRELMAGKVQMIYIDPPYGVAYNSNFQPSTRKRDVRDGQDDSLTREPEMIKAYRDTWTLGIHSYLTYLRDRLLLARELLHESGSIFVQISAENLHHVREVAGEVFGESNFCGQVSFVKAGGQTTELLAQTADWLLWFAKDRSQAKFRPLYVDRAPESLPATLIWYAGLADGTIRRLTQEEIENPKTLPPGSKPFWLADLLSRSGSSTTQFDFEFGGRKFAPTRGGWRTTLQGMRHLAAAGRLQIKGDTLLFRRYLDDFRLSDLTAVWTDTQLGGFRQQEKIFVVQTPTKVVARCVLMTTDPGDLVFDPTCGSGTTAYVAEQWGRRWITCDTSRVALALAKQRIMTATFPYYALAHPEQGVDSGFRYSREGGSIVPHVTLKSIAQGLSAEEEILYDRPDIDKRKVRVSGPFTVEAIPTPAIEDPTESPIAQWESLEPDARADDIARRGHAAADESTNFILNMIESLRKDGLTRVGGGSLRFSKLNPIPSAGVLQAEGEIDLGDGQARLFAVSFGPRYGPVTMAQVEEAVQQSRGRYDGVVILGFTFDGPAQEFLKRDLPIQVMGAYINNDVLVGDLLKTPKGSQLFTLFGQADIGIEKTKDGYVVEVRGVDLYNPQTGEVESEGGSEIAAWFLDPDYDQRTFNIGQAFFPGGTNAWEKLQRALKGIIDPDQFEQLRGLKSLPFESGEQKRVAVKVIDHRGNEMLEVFELSKVAAG
jgi:adenine-specific DNA-methyltransferase